MRTYAYNSSLSPRTRLLNAFRSVLIHRPFETLLQKVVYGQPANSLIGRLVPPEYLYAKGTVRHFKRGGMVYHLDLSNTTDHWAFFGFADNGDDHLRALIERDHVIVDIGANIGIRTMNFAAAATNGKVIAFEPHPITFQRLLEHITLNGFTHVEAFNLGIGPKASSEQLYQVVDSNSGMNRIVQSGMDMQHFTSTEIQLTPLAPVLAELGVGHVDIIKMDVEGYEMEALKGCQSVIDRDRPLLFIELDDDNLKDNGSTALAVVDWLKQFDYQIQEAVTLAPLPSDLSHCHLDILCTHEQSHRLAL